MFRKISFMIFSLFLLPSLHAEVFELTEGFTIDLDHVKEISASCPSQGGYPVPGNSCIKRCYGGTNNSKYGVTCKIEATGIFYEVFTMNTPSGPQTWETGNKLLATDIRYIAAYPFSETTVCFNFGKDVVYLWKYSRAIIQERNCTIDYRER